MNILITILIVYIALGIYTFLGENLNWFSVWNVVVGIIFCWYFIPFVKLYDLLKDKKRKKKKN